MTSVLGESDIKTFLIRLYFGPVTNPVRKSVNRAYRDFNRTLRGFAQHPHSSEIRSCAGAHLESALSTLNTANIHTQNDFDIWHKELCTELKQLYAGFPFTVGQAQKWVNMSVKYLFILDRGSVDSHWHYCHIPIDRIVITRLRQLGHEPPSIGRAWSRLDSYSEYLDFQTWFRQPFRGIPMDNEFVLWMGSINGMDQYRDTAIGGDIDPADHSGIGDSPSYPACNVARSDISTP